MKIYEILSIFINFRQFRRNLPQNGPKYPQSMGGSIDPEIYPRNLLPEGV